MLLLPMPECSTVGVSDPGECPTLGYVECASVVEVDEPHAFGRSRCPFCVSGMTLGDIHCAAASRRATSLTDVLAFNSSWYLGGWAVPSTTRLRPAGTLPVFNAMIIA